MSTTTTPIASAALRLIVKLDDAGKSGGEIAATLNETGVPVPRHDERPALLARPDGYNLPTEPGKPGRWNAPAVAAVLEAPEVASGIGAETAYALTIE